MLLVCLARSRVQYEDHLQPFGRYRFLRLASDLNLSQDMFQERMDLNIAQCPGNISIADDVGVFGRTEEVHNASLHQLMRAAQKHAWSSTAISAKSTRVSCTSSAWYSIQMVSTLIQPGLTTFVVWRNRRMLINYVSSLESRPTCFHSYQSYQRTQRRFVT